MILRVFVGSCRARKADTLTIQQTRSVKFLKNEKSKDYCKADFKQRVLFFLTIFRLAIPVFFRFTDVTDVKISYNSENTLLTF